MGAASNTGVEGNSWSSSISGTNRIYLLFDMQRLLCSSPVNCAHGFQLRCLSE
ncbi:hypothetical protein [uncultured Rikenella sp.]|uniref:hypothetical protein n=1 Tax=uncultured Rikenella sp. TaxID=368003 RepID=UPI0025E1A43D|nr:hypothetical protein [uncultured Rikenella sp.]